MGNEGLREGRKEQKERNGGIICQIETVTVGGKQSL